MAQNRLPPLNWLRVFEVAARHQSFSVAAGELNVSPSAISQQISTLEDTLGYALFERRTQGVSLTPLGEAFAQDVARAIGELGASVERLFPLPGTQVVTLQANSIFVNSWLPPRLPWFQAVYPGIDISVISQDDYSAYKAGRADIQISFATDLSAIGKTEDLFSETVYPVATKAIAARIASARDVLGYSLIENPANQLNWARLFDLHGGVDRADTGNARMLRVSTTTLALSLATSGAGIALARAPATDWLVEALGLVPLTPFEPIAGEARYSMVVRQDARSGGATHLLRNWLLSEAERTQG